MLCLVDESGDVGLKIGEGSSEFFTVTVVFFRDREEAQSCDNRITQLRQELSIKKEFEFHFASASNRIKTSFFAAVMEFDFLYVAMTIDKAKLYGFGLQHPKIFYKYVCRIVFETLKPHLEDAKIIFDGQGSQQFKRELQSYLKKHLNKGDTRCVKQVRVQDSHKNNLIQLADMVCGAIAESLKAREQSDKHYKSIVVRELSWQMWPKHVDEVKKATYLSASKKERKKLAKNWAKKRG
jgi:hypothetical protein